MLQSLEGLQPLEGLLVPNKYVIKANIHCGSGWYTGGASVPKIVVVVGCSLVDGYGIFGVGFRGGCLGLLKMGCAYTLGVGVYIRKG